MFFLSHKIYMFFLKLTNFTYTLAEKNSFFGNARLRGFCQVKKIKKFGKNSEVGQWLKPQHFLYMFQEKKM